MKIGENTATFAYKQYSRRPVGGKKCDQMETDSTDTRVNKGQIRNITSKVVKLLNVCVATLITLF